MQIHPTIAAMLQKSRDAGVPALSAGTPAQGRAVMAAMRPILAEAAAREGGEPGTAEIVEIPTRSGSIEAILLRPDGPASGLVVYLHGGGWVIGEAADFEVLGRSLARETGCAVLLVNYRKAPEHPFPAGLEDCEDAVLWAGKHVAAIADGASSIVVAGDSAGGNLAAVTALSLRGAGTLRGQVLIYPVADCDMNRPSFAAYGTGLILTPTDMRWFFNHYAPEHLWTDPRISPLRAADLSRLPRTSVVLAECDILHDEGIAFAAALRSAGVDVTLREYPGMTHGFIRLHPFVDVAAQALRDIAGDIRAMI
jgi:acetyl esterase